MFCGETEFTAESARRYSTASNRVAHQARAAEVERVRERLGLDRKQLALLTGELPWDDGSSRISWAVVNLMRLFDRDPERLEELRG